MIGISIAATPEWEATIEYFNIQKENLISFPYGEYFKITLKGKELPRIKRK